MRFCTGQTDFRIGLRRLRVELLRKHSICRATYFNWRSKYAGESVAELKWMKELDAENAKLKQPYAYVAPAGGTLRRVRRRGRAEQQWAMPAGTDHAHG